MFSICDNRAQPTLLPLHLCQALSGNVKVVVGHSVTLMERNFRTVDNETSRLTIKIIVDIRYYETYNELSNYLYLMTRV